MFTWRHFLWLGICLVLSIIGLHIMKKRNLPISKALTSACIAAILSEIIKVFSTIEMVPSADGSLIFPYLPMNHLPLHLCSIQIPLIFYARFTDNEKGRENVLSFMYPSCFLGGIMALAMPSIFQTTIKVEQAFTHPMAYQFFLYHIMLVTLGLYIAISGHIKWERRHLVNTYLFTYTLSFLSLYTNSMFASPVYEGGKLISVEFWPNFFFTYNNPLGLKITTETGWRIYLLIILTVSALLIFLCFVPLLFKKKKNV